MNIYEIKRRYAREVAAKFAEKGYTVYLQPEPSILPAFMEDFRPDAVALGPRMNFAIEVLTRGLPDVRDRARLNEAFKQSDNWELRVHYVDPLVDKDELAPASPWAIEQSIASVDLMIQRGDAAAALVMAFATLEALGRSLLPEELARPRSVVQVVEHLAFAGEVTPGEADILGRLGALRNKVAHGKLDADIDVEDMKKLHAVLQSLLETLKNPVAG